MEQAPRSEGEVFVTQPYALYNPGTHVAVPREPTQAMRIAGVKADDNRTGYITCAHIFSAMLAAAPPHVVDDSDTLLNAVTAFESGKAEGFLAGAKAMQEAAAGIVENYAAAKGMPHGRPGLVRRKTPSITSISLSAAIRALDPEKVGG